MEACKAAATERSACRRIHHRHTGFIQRNNKRLPVLLDDVLGCDKGDGARFRFDIIIFTFVNARPEHDFGFSVGAYFRFPDAHDSITAFFFKQFAEFFRNAAFHCDIHC